MILDFYYFLGLFILISVVSQIFLFNKLFKITEWISKFKKVTDERPVKKDFESEEDYNLISGRDAFLIIEGIWLIIGFLTNNWFAFLGLSLYSLLLGILYKTILKKLVFSLLGKLLYFKFFIIKALVYAFLIINHFHLKLDLWEIVKGFLLSQ